MQISSKVFIDHLYYNKLPKVYRDYDSQIGLPLYRYLTALLDGGYGYILKSINDLTDLFDPELCPKVCLPYMCRSFGLTYYSDIPEIYWRRLLSNIGEIMKRRGTYSCIKYLVRALTGLNVTLSYRRGYNDDNTKYGRFLTATISANDVNNILNLDVTTKVIEKFINEFVPYYITSVDVAADIKTQIFSTTLVRYGTVTQNISSKILPFASKDEDVKDYYYRGGLVCGGSFAVLKPNEI